jgi:hypothetical protein
MSLAVADPHTGDGQFLRDYAGIGQELLDRYIPFGVAVAADGFFYKKEFTKEELAGRFQLLIEPRNSALKGAQLAAISDLKTESKVHVWDDRGMAPVLSKIQPWITCDQPGVFVLPRRKPGDSAAPLIVHLINRYYREKEDCVEPKRDIKLTLRQELLRGRIVSVECLSPDTSGQTLTWEAAPDGIVVTVPALQYWNVLKLNFANPVERKL